MFTCIRLQKRKQCCEPKIGGETPLTSILSSGSCIDDKRQPWPNADKKSGPQLLTGPKLLSFGPTLFKY